jgi:hypothetical protein
LLPSLLLQPCICLCTAAGAPGAGTHCCACQLLQPHACALIRLHRPACSSMQQVHTAAQPTQPQEHLRAVTPRGV